jgi:cell division transport system permease protein
MRLRFVLSEMALGLRRNLTLTLAVIITVAVSLGLTASGLLLRAQVQSLKSFWYDKLAVEVYMCTSTDARPPCNHQARTDQQLQDVQSQIKALPGIKDVKYESPEESLRRAKEQFADQPEILKTLTLQNIGDSYRVQLDDPTKFPIVKSALQGRPGVESVRDEQHVLEHFFKILNAFQAMALVTATGVLLAAVVLIGNTIRVAVLSRRREIGIMRLVGASNLYIQLPFLLEGALTGLLGGLIAWGGIAVIKSVLIDHQLKPAFGFTAQAFVGWDNVFSIGLLLTIVGIFVSALVAFVTLSMSRAARV